MDTNRAGLALVGMAAATIMATVLPSDTLADSSKLEHLQTLCQSNVKCSNEDASDGKLFKVRLPSRTQSILCQGDGTCQLVLTRGKRSSVADVESLLSEN